MSKIAYSPDKPNDCRYCHFWKNNKKGCCLGEDKCYYLISVPQKPKSECDGCLSLSKEIDTLAKPIDAHADHNEEALRVTGEPDGGQTHGSYSITIISITTTFLSKKKSPDRSYTSLRAKSL